MGYPLYTFEQEIDLIYQIFKDCGTPDVSKWPHVAKLPAWDSVRKGSTHSVIFNKITNLILQKRPVRFFVHGSYCVHACYPWGIDAHPRLLWISNFCALLQDLTEKEKRQVRDAVRVAVRMLCVYPHERPSCKELLQDKFFTDETSGEALRSTPAQKLKAVAVDITSGPVNGMFWVHALSSILLPQVVVERHRLYMCI